jgi:hypothetical protein
VYLDRVRSGRELAQYRREDRQRELETYRQVQEMYHPAPLTSDQFNPETGEITWPAALQQARFAEDREQLEELFAMQSRGSGTDDTARKISVLIRLLEIKLKDEIGSIPQDEYTAASNFLASLRQNAWVAAR